MGFKNPKEWFRLCMPGISLLAPTGRGSWSTVESRNPRVRIKEGITEEVSTLNLKAGNSCMYHLDQAQKNSTNESCRGFQSFESLKEHQKKEKEVTSNSKWDEGAGSRSPRDFSALPLTTISLQQDSQTSVLRCKMR